jgi:hypothetical protein
MAKQLRSQALTEHTRNLIMLAARLHTVHDALMAAALALNAYEVRLDSESPKLLRQGAKDLIRAHFDDLRLNRHSIEHCLEQDAPIPSSSHSPQEQWGRVECGRQRGRPAAT